MALSLHELFRALHDAIAELDRRTRILCSATGDASPPSNISGLLSSYLASWGCSVTVHYGRIQEAIPFARAYRVAPSDGGPILVCTRLLDNASLPVGVNDNSTLQVDTNVYYLRHPDADYGVIIGAEPKFGHDARTQLPDYITQGSNAGYRVDPFYWNAIGIAGTGMGDWSEGRQPVDSIELNHFTKTSATGVQLHIDDFMAHFRVNEHAGLFLNYLDGAVRLAGMLLQIWGPGLAIEQRNDVCELLHLRRYCMFPWEYLGGMFSVNPCLPIDAEYMLNSHQYFGGSEPYIQAAQPFARIQEYYGYLTNGFRRWIAAPIQSPAVYCYWTDQTPIGLLDHLESMAGAFGVRSAPGPIALVKYALIPVPHERIRPEEEAFGNNSSNYKFSSYCGSGESHTFYPTPRSSSNNLCQRHGGLFDLFTQVFNWSPLAYKKLDYHYPDESAYGGKAYERISFSELKGSQELSPPEPYTIVLDHRQGSRVEIYPNIAYITILEEGSILIGDGYGSEIRMGGGNIRITAPGDIMLEAGRNVVMKGGRDVSLAAYQSADISATLNDVRIKAERNIMALAGNCGIGGILLESRASSASYELKRGQEAELSGVIVHCPQSEFLGMGKSIYLRSRIVEETKREGGEVSVPSRTGDIVLDAGGQDDPRVVHLYGQYVKNWVTCAVLHGYGPPDSPEQSAIFTKDGTALPGGLYVDGHIVNKGHHICRNDIVTTEGHVYASESGLVGEADAGMDSVISQGNSYIYEVNAWNSTCWYQEIVGPWFQSSRPGTDEFQKSIWFGFRRSREDYGTQSLVMCESRWQQLARRTGTIPTKWSETAVYDCAFEKTYPWPGEIIETACYQTQDLNLFDLAAGRSKDRESVCKNPQYASPSPQAWQDNYPIIGKP